MSIRVESIRVKSIGDRETARAKHLMCRVSALFCTVLYCRSSRRAVAIDFSCFKRMHCIARGHMLNIRTVNMEHTDRFNYMTTGSWAVSRRVIVSLLSAQRPRNAAASQFAPIGCFEQWPRFFSPLVRTDRKYLFIIPLHISCVLRNRTERMFLLMETT